MIIKGLSFKASANSPNESKVVPAVPINSLIFVVTLPWTKAVVASCVVLVGESAVGAVGIPVNAVL